ncbi:hypothetical protein [Kibdelosporangium persicum]|uniref:hypothetical protein n=1 Tax=Kibdelosporangium persicum TaxID=2698649 RepID=UPI0015637CDA|nr:hypothetical protein [Kibdelosporangium persicum]
MAGAEEAAIGTVSMGGVMAENVTDETSSWTASAIFMHVGKRSRCLGKIRDITSRGGAPCTTQPVGRSLNAALPRWSPVKPFSDGP